MSATVTQRATQDGLIVTIVGDVDMASAPVVKAKVTDAVHRQAVSMVLDLSNVRLVDDVGVGVLLGVRRSVMAGGGSLSLIVSDPVDRALAAFGVAELFLTVTAVD